MGAEGGLCAKGEAALQVLYDPNRLNKPLRRTNPEKGLFADPRWKEITWEEAFAEIVPRLKKIIEKDPRKLQFMFASTRNGLLAERAPISAFLGKFNMGGGGAGLHCGGAHPVSGMVYGSWSMVPDFRYCNYAVYFGANKGYGAGHSAMITARQAAEAKNRSIKTVVFDPICNFSSAKATEWIPLIPGTDGAIILAMCNVIVNELGIYDERYLKLKTNAPYLIGPDRHYVRENGPARGVKGKTSRSGRSVTFVGDDDTNKPLVWDVGEGKAKVYDDPSIKDFALEGEYKVKEVKCQPVFQLIREHLKNYTVEMASKVSTVPAETIRRIATEFAQAAQIGSTITIDGQELPLRPASGVLFRGGEGHENSHHSCFSLALLNSIIGGCDVPGGTLGWPARTLGYPGSGRPKWEPYKGIDGFLTIEHHGPTSGTIVNGHPHPWPIALPQKNNALGLRTLFPLMVGSFIWSASDQDEIWQKLGIDHRIEMIIDWACNPLLSVANQEILDNVLKKIPFIVVFELFNSEFTEGYADIVLPDTSSLEMTNWGEGLALNFNHAFGLDDWCYHILQPVVPLKSERRCYIDVLYELADRLGKRKEFNEAVNTLYGLEKPYELKPDEKVFLEEISDRAVKSIFGPEHDLEWFKKNGYLRWPKKVEEAYWRYSIDARTPIYLEYLLDMGAKLREIDKESGLGVDLSQYTPLISWFPCSIHSIDKPEYDLICYSYRDVLHTGSATMEQPWLDEASRMNPYTYSITMNVDIAREKGIKDGDKIEVETFYGRKVQGTIKLMEGQHPRTMGIAACSGHWAKGQPIAQGKGTNFDTLLEMDLKHVDPVGGNCETAVRVKVKKVEEG